MIKRSLWILALTAVLSACSSGVKLSDVPVEDKNAVASNVGAVADAAQSSVASVVSAKAGSQGVAPAGVNVIYFDYDSFALKPEARAVLSAMLRICKPISNSRFSLKATPMNAVDVSTTWLWVRSELKLFVVL